MGYGGKKSNPIIQFDNKELRDQVQVAATTPRFFLNPLAGRTGTRNGSTTSGEYLTFIAFYHVYDLAYQNTGALYGLEQPFTGRTIQKVARSIDGGRTWTVLGSIPSNIDGGERIQKIYVEPIYETIFVQRAININASPVQYTIESWNNTLTTKIGSLDIGTHYWHAASHNIDSYFDWTTMTTMFAEYGGTENSVFRVWKTTNKGATWTQAFSQTGNNGVTGAGEIRHFHCLQIDPFTNHWWLGSGDIPSQCKIWKSTDNGVTWTLVGGGSEDFRTLGFVFEKDHIYWGMDSTTNSVKVAIFKSPKNDLSLREAIGYQAENYPIYQITKTYFPNGFLIFPQHEPPLIFKGKVSVQFYDLEDKKLKTVAQLNFNDLNPSDYHGFLGEGSRYQDRNTGMITTQLSSNLVNKFMHTGGSTVVTGAMLGKLSM